MSEQIQVREARKEDAEQLLEVYHRFAEGYVGPARRDVKVYRRLLRKKDKLHWIALDEQEAIIGYISCRYDKKGRQGWITEIIADPNHDFKRIAKMLVSEVYEALQKRNVAAVYVDSIKNPAYTEIFPQMDFFDAESSGVFMYAILDASKFLNEIAPVMVKRLKKLEEWRGLMEIKCEGNSIFIQKDDKDAHAILWTSRTADFRIVLSPALLTKILFGAVDPIEAYKAGKLKVQTTVNPTKREQLLETMFPERHFLILDYW